ncbi:lipopolysaccharide assembly LapA domain-containing protein [Chitinibacter sp. ZOR0017]|uniref:LapA family protein n=1 Tax=Chitinibacter sp. ZOR0017 TaxID=1339254 RepID=UPI000647A634|nr:lipopolysaccharide assembly protein LapA domain-containing protein [Chitinibacter sp. ZOR0017]
MQYLGWIVKFLIFVLLFGFAMHNAVPVDLHFFLGYVWNAPLAMILLVFFVLGVVFGLLASFSQVFRLRRELVKLRKENKQLAPITAPLTDSPLIQPKDAI